MSTPANGSTEQPALNVSRRALLQFSSSMCALLALPATAVAAMAEGLAKSPRQSVIWLSFQECTGCTESLSRSYSPTLESLIFDVVSLDYHHTLQAASGEAAERARDAATAANKGRYILVVDGAVSTKDGGLYSTIAGVANLDMLRELARDAKAIIAVGTCAAFGGVAKAKPNPTGAAGVQEVVTGKPLINISGCPPVPEAIAGVLAHLVAFGKPPELDRLKRPVAFFPATIHQRCYRRPFYREGLFAKSFDDDGARKGYCLYYLGCKGPVTRGVCATRKWNGGVSFPIQSGHGCLGCTEPNFWDRAGFYQSLDGRGGRGGSQD